MQCGVTTSTVTVQGTGAQARQALQAACQTAGTAVNVPDSAGNIVCATQSQSLHFGAGVVPPGTGVVMNDSMSNFAYTNPESVNYVAPGKRARSTISPSIVFRAGKPIFAIGIPGAARIPTAMLQALLDRLTLNRPLAEAIGDTRMHYVTPLNSNERSPVIANLSTPRLILLTTLALLPSPPAINGSGFDPRPEARDRLVRSDFVVNLNSDRMGYRLDDARSRADIVAYLATLGETAR